jgi:hypothetical protein
MSLYVGRLKEAGFNSMEYTLVSEDHQSELEDRYVMHRFAVLIFDNC